MFDRKEMMQRVSAQQQAQAQQRAEWEAEQRRMAQEGREAPLRAIMNKAPKYRDSLKFDEFKDFKKFAYGTEDSPYAALQRERIGSQEMQGLDQATAASQQGLGNIYSQLAMGGGLRGGTRERMAADLGQQSLMDRQGIRQSAVDGMRDLDQQQNQQRMGAQEAYLQARQSENQAKQNFGMDRWRQNAEIESAMLKSQSEREVAAANACLLEGTAVKLEDGRVVNIEDVQVGDQLPGGIVYTVQKSMAPMKLYKWNGAYMTGGHAVNEDGKWLRAKDSKNSVMEVSPDGKCFIYNLGLTRHFITLATGQIVGDLHETNDYEFISDADSLERMNSEIPIQQVC